MALEGADIPESPAWWLIRLSRRLRADIDRMNILEDYYVGEHPLPEGDRQRARIYRAFQRRARSNYAGLVVEAVKERLHVDGFRAGGAETDTQDQGAWRIWQANRLDAESTLIHQHALTMGKAYVIIGADPQTRGDDQDGDVDDPAIPVITAEDARQVAHESNPANRRQLRAAIKIYDDELDGKQHAVLYLPGEIWYFVGTGEGANSDRLYRSDGSIDPRGWSFEVSEDNPDGMAANPLGVVPVVPFYNRPRISVDGYVTLGEFEDVIDIQDRINGTVLDRLVIARMQAYRQRYVAGVEPERDDNDNPVEPWDPDVTSLWVAVDPQTKFGDFAQSDIEPILNAIRSDITDLAAITRTPPHYLLGQMVNLSGDALEAAETGLVSKVRERMRYYGEAWEQVMRIAGLYGGVQVASDAEVIWADPTQRSLLDLAAAAVQQMAAGVPWRTRMATMGYTPSAIDRMEAERAQDALLAQMGNFPNPDFPGVAGGGPGGAPPPRGEVRAQL